MLGRRRRWWPNSKPLLYECLGFVIHISSSEKCHNFIPSVISQKLSLKHPFLVDYDIPCDLILLNMVHGEKYK